MAVPPSNILFPHVAQSCLFVIPWTVACQTSLSMGILQVRILEWVAMPFSRGSSQPRDRTQVSQIAGGFSTVRVTIPHVNWIVEFFIVKMFIISIQVFSDKGRETMYLPFKKLIFKIQLPPLEQAISLLSYFKLSK